MRGVVIRTLPERGFLFVQDDDGRTRFIHANSFVTPMDFHEAKVGAHLEFVPIDNAERGHESSNKLRGKDCVLANG